MSRRPSAPELPRRYEVVSALKETARTCVFRVLDSVTRRELALKTLCSPDDPIRTMRFRREFETLAAIEHPNVVRVFDFGLLKNGAPYFTMEYLAGRRLTEFFDGKDWPALHRAALQIASALHHVHARGLLHLDVKPSNVIVEDSGVATLMDFGLAGHSEQMLDRTIRGTLPYIAPEVLAQESADFRADLYSFGMTLYETVSGTLPGYGRSTAEIIRMRLDEDVRRASTINPRIPDALDEIIARLVERDPRDRFPSAAALFQALAEASGSTQRTPEIDAAAASTYAAPLIGREREVGTLQTLIERARAGAGGAVILAGREGVGKHRIVREVTLRAQIDGAHVFCGRCPTNRQTVYAPFIDVFRAMLGSISGDPPAGFEIDRLLTVETPDVTDALAEQGQKFRLFNRVAQTLEDFHGLLRAGDATASEPLLLLVEDLHHADASTADLFSFLAAEAARKPLVLIGTLTTDSAVEDAPDPRDDAARSWSGAAGDGAMQILSVDPLPPPLVREYLAAVLGDASLPDDFVKWVSWETGGLPLAIRRMVELLAAEGHLTWTPDGWRVGEDLPATVQLTGHNGAPLLERLEGVSTTERLVIEAAAVLGDDFAAHHLLELGDSSREDVAAAVARLLDIGLLEESSDEKSFAFPHTHLRQAVYASTADVRRAELHRSAAELFEAERKSGGAHLIGQVAFHFARANDVERGSRAAIEAGDHAAASVAFEEAADFYRVALELMDLGGHDEAAKAAIREKLADAYFRRDDYRRAIHVYQFLLRSIHARAADGDASLDLARVTRKLGKVLSRRGDIDGAMAHLQHALAIYEEQGTLIDVAEVLSRIAWLHKLHDDLPSARSAAERAQTVLADRPVSAVAGYVENILGVIEYAAGEWESSLRFLHRALAIADEVSSAHLRRVASTNLGNTLWKIGDWTAALEHFRRSAEQSEAEGDLWELVPAYNNVGVVEHGRSSFKAAAAMFDKSLEIGARIDSREHELATRENRGESWEMLGRWSEALVEYEKCLSLASPDESRATVSSVLVPLARLTRKRGDIAKALEYAQKAVAAGERSRDDDLLAEALHALAGIEEERENLEEAARHVTRALELFEKRGTLHGLARAHTTAASIEVRRDDLESASLHAERGSELARQLGDSYTAARCDWVRGRIAAARADREDAARRFESARALFEQLECPYELARVQLEIGLSHESPEDGSEIVRSAIRVFERLHAALDLERARGALFRLRPAGRGAAQNVVGLYEIVKIINSTLQVEEVLNRVLDVCLRRLRAERGLILLLDPITGALRTRIARNINERSDPRNSPQIVVREVIQSGSPVVSADAASDERFTASESVIADHILSVACVPLIIRERIAGAIYVDHRQARNLFAEKDLTFLEAFADQAAIAIENARLYEELEEARARLSAENETLRKELLVEKHLDSIVGESDEVARIQFAIRKAAAGHSTVLIRGESGTGKGLVARIIHNVGPRRNGPFIKFNCAALPESLAESELFGHEKGAFTGADRRKLGRFELAHNGTIFLDEIGKLSLAMQAKLLRVVEEKEFERVGGVQTIRSDVKIIAATNLELERAISDGTFREDLFYRLNIVPITLPPLRDRKQDIPLLAEHFMRKICKDLGLDLKRLQPGIIDLFFAYDWPGNVRELEATLHRAIVMANGDVITKEEIVALFGGTITKAVDESAGSAGTLEAEPVAEITSDVYESKLAEVDRHLITRALAESGGRIREAARRLGLARNTLKAKMVRYGISGRDDESRTRN